VRRGVYIAHGVYPHQEKSRHTKLGGGKGEKGTCAILGGRLELESDSETHPERMEIKQNA